jgi:7-keto-8-aminopelargonate synthetase-like enzyme
MGERSKGARGKLQPPNHEVQGPKSKVQGRLPRTLVVTESVFSMDGDLAPLRDIVELKDRYGAWLMVDEAHATGLFGARRRGVAEAHEVSGRAEIQMGTLGKALGASGGYVCGSRALIDLLVNRARSFIFSTAPVPSAAAAARAGIELLQSSEGEERRMRVWSLIDQLKNALVAGSFKVPVVQSAIVPVIIGAEDEAVGLATRLRDRNIFVPAIRYPTVARGKARLRITLTAEHTSKDVQQLVAALNDNGNPRR